jgi:IclR family transcriptional regulator, KDG regulon repressor
MSSTLKCFQLLEVLAQEPYEFPLSDLALRLDQPLSSVHRLGATLVEAGFAEQDEVSKRYRLAGTALWAGAGYLRNSAVYRAAFLVMQEAARTGPGLVHLGALHHNWVLYLHTVGSPSRLYLYADTGERRPLHATGLGKAILAWQSAKVLERVLATKLTRFTPHTICSAAQLKEDLRVTRERGYAIDNEEGVLGLRCVAAPVLDASGQGVAALSMSAPASVMTKGQLQTAAELICESAMKVSAQIGFRPASAFSLNPRIGGRVVS